MKSMLHRHMDMQEYTPGTVDDVVARGVLKDWLELRAAAAESSAIVLCIKKICEHQISRSEFPSRYIFWQNYLKWKYGDIHEDERS